jgi:hypothetical protein
VGDVTAKAGRGQLRGRRAPSDPMMSVVFRPHPGLLTQTREFVASFCGTFVRDPDLVYRVTIAVHELLENVIKYSCDGATDMTIELRNEDEGSPVAIRVENRALPDHIASVRDAIDRIHEAADPFELYCQMIHASVARGTHSGLGLVRICAEAACDLDYSIVGDVLALSARAHVGRGAMA